MNMDYTTIYLIGALVLVGLFAARIPHENVRVVFALALIWPVSIAFIVSFLAMYIIGWNIDAAKGTKMFGFRRPSNENVRGFAVSIFYGEVQVWKLKR